MQNWVSKKKKKKKNPMFSKILGFGSVKKGQTTFFLDLIAWNPTSTKSKLFQIEFSILFEELLHQHCKFEISIKLIKLLGCTKQYCKLWLPKNLILNYCVNLIVFARPVTFSLLSSK